jgi:hypothetical protein
MDLNDTVIGKFNKNSMDRKVFHLLSILMIIVGLFIVAGILFPTTVSMILNSLWVVLVTFVITFFFLGFLVIFGMRKEVGSVLDAFLEGSLKIIDFLELVRDLWYRFIQLVKDFFLFAAPFFAYIIAAVVYVLLIIIYKSVGRTGDVTILTIAITVFCIAGFGIISRPTADPMELTWIKHFFKRLRFGLVDAFEVILFIFFLTMDSTSIFFLPQELNVPIKAVWGSYDFMVKSFVYSDHMKITINIIVGTIAVEIIRNFLRIFAVARQYYLEYVNSFSPEEHKGILIIIKNSIRKSFGDAKDDLIKFITLNTVLFAVFLLFPRLKLFTLLLASCTNLIMDLVFRSRLTVKKGTDLISRTLSYVFKV